MTNEFVDVPGDETTSIGKPPRVLVIDDEPGICLAIRFLLQPRYLVETVNTADAAIARVAQGGVSCILMDMHMPGVIGYALFDHLHRLAPDTPIVVLSAACEAHMRAEALARGARGFVEKPFTRQELLACLQDIGADVQGG